MRFAAALTALSLIVGFAVAEDKVTLKDGKVITGEVLSITRNDIQIQTDAEKIRVPLVAVDRVERNGSLLDLDHANLRTSRPARAPRAMQRRTYEATPALLAWLDVCALQLAADDEGVRAGATAALLSAGKIAIPALEKASESDERISPIAKRIVNQIERMDQRMAPSTSQVEPIQRFVSTLKLTDEQEPKFKLIMNDYQRKQSELRQSIRNGETQMSDVEKQAAVLREEADKKLAEVLTQEQLRHYKKITPRGR